MDQDKILREHLVSLLKGGNAHMTFYEATADFPLDKINTVFTNGDYSFWQLLEHIRRTQADILDFMINPEYKELEWPTDYWPERNIKATESEWIRTIKLFNEDLHELIKIAEDKKIDLYKKIPHGTGQTILRELLLVADHSAYHIGEFAIMRQVLKTWGTSH